MSTFYQYDKVTLFSKLHCYRREYDALETCVTASVLSCADLHPLKVEEIVVGTLRNTLQTKRVWFMLRIPTILEVECTNVDQSWSKIKKSWIKQTTKYISIPRKWNMTLYWRS